MGPDAYANPAQGRRSVLVTVAGWLLLLPGLLFAIGVIRDLFRLLGGPNGYLASGSPLEAYITAHQLGYLIYDSVWALLLVPAAIKVLRRRRSAPIHASIVVVAITCLVAVGLFAGGPVVSLTGQALAGIAVWLAWCGLILFSLWRPVAKAEFGRGSPAGSAARRGKSLKRTRPAAVAPGGTPLPPLLSEISAAPAGRPGKGSRRVGKLVVLGALFCFVLVVGAGAWFYGVRGPRLELWKEKVRGTFGSVDDCLTLAWRYRKGDGAPQNFAEAATWFEKAAKRGSAKGQYDLGVLYYYGLGTTASTDEARSWFEKASAQNYAPAMTFLGLIDRNDLNDPDRAVSLWNQAARLRDPWAEYLLGSAYLERRADDDQNLVLALFWLEQARRDGVEPIKGLIQHVWATVPDDQLDAVSDEVYKRLDEANTPAN